MLNHILVPLDGSAVARQAIEHGLKIVDPKGRITFVTAIDMPEMMPGDFYPVVGASLGSVAVNGIKDRSTQPDDLVSQAREYLETMAQRVAANSDLQIDSRIEIDEPAVVILKIATELDVDAIVMSTHGRSGLSRWLFGSVTTKVLNHADRPVYVIPSQDRRKLTGVNKTVDAAEE